MSGYVYCLRNNHAWYGQFVKIGFTESATCAIRAEQLAQKWRCSFEVLWDIEVYEPAKAEAYLHDVLFRFRYDYEFFRIEPSLAKKVAEEIFDEHWRELEDRVVSPPSLTDLVDGERAGLLLDTWQATDRDSDSCCLVEEIAVDNEVWEK